MRATARSRLMLVLSVGALIGVLGACAPSAPAPAPTTAPTAKPAAAASPAAAAPAASPAAAASPVASTASPVAVPKPVTVAGFPSKPVEIVVPFPPGGGYDALSRQLAVPLQRVLNQAVVIKNAPGGGQRIGARQFQQSPADGHTIGYFADTQLFVSGVVEDPQGVDVSNWGWIAGLRYHSPAVLVVGKNTPFNSVADIVAADQSGQRLRLGHNGIGGFLATHVVLAEALGLRNVVHVGGFSGTGDVMPAMARGDLDVFVNLGVSSALQFIRSGDIRAVAVLWPQDGRSPLLPDVPNARELGLASIADVEQLGASRSGLAAVPGTSAQLVQALESAVLEAVKDEAFLEWAKQSGFESEVSPLSAQDFRERKRREFEFWKKYEDSLKKAVQ